MWTAYTLHFTIASRLAIATGFEPGIRFMVWMLGERHTKLNSWDSLWFTSRRDTSEDNLLRS